MTTYIRSSEAAKLLGVSPATLYAYVSRGKIARRTAPDGRASLFARDEVESLAARSRRAPSGPRPSIDVRISSSITHLDEGGVAVRGHDLSDLATTRHFEDVAELLWSAALPTGTTWPPATPRDREAVGAATAAPVDPVARLAIAAHLLDAAYPADAADVAARRLLVVAPPVLGARRQTGSYARRLATAWARTPTDGVVDAIDTALSLLADHELATSTLAVRVAASVRASAYAAFAAGLATVQGTLHGSASHHSHALLARAAVTSPAEEVERLRRANERIPGFGHKVYRGPDPRFAVLLGAVRHLADEPDAPPDAAEKMAIVDATVAEVGRAIPKHPNVDLALGALTWIAGLDADVPLFAVARVAGWGAHYAEELDAAPVRFRGISS